MTPEAEPMDSAGLAARDRDSGRLYRRCTGVVLLPDSDPSADAVRCGIGPSPEGWNGACCGE